MDREALDADLGRAAKRAGIKIAAPVRKAIYTARLGIQTSRLPYQR
jgi:hypothetical protein